MNPTDPRDKDRLATDAPDLAGSGESWAWLAALARSLDLAAEVVDQHGKAGPSVGVGGTPTALHRHLTDPNSAVSAAVGMALASDQVQRVSVGTLSAICQRLVVQGTVFGALVLAREAGDQLGSSRERSLANLEAAGPWLARSVEAHLAFTFIDDGDEAFDRVSSLHRLLHDAVERGNEREVATAFAEALFAWDGVEMTSYVEDIQGRLTLAVAAPGAVKGHATVTFQPGASPRSNTLTRLSGVDLDRFGLPRTRQVAAIEIGSSTLEPWLLLFAEGFRSLNASRLVLYADLLREALGRASTIAETRTTWAILQSLLGATEASDRTVAAALGELRRALDGVGASLVVTNASGAALLTVGDDAEGAPVIPASDRGHQLTSTAQLPDRCTMELSLRRIASQAFTRREQHLVDRAAAIFSAWLPGTLKRSIPRAERRSEHRGFEQALDRAATQILRDGIDVSVLVLMVGDAASRPGLLHSWVTEIRAQLRGSDLAGTLSDREIGVLLSGTPQGDVPVVCSRLRRRLGLDAAMPVTIGVASRGAGHLADDSIVGAARRDLSSRGAVAVRDQR
jgi:hypothetical protein